MRGILIVDNHEISTRVQSALSERFDYTIVDRMPKSALERLNDGLQPNVIVSDIYRNGGDSRVQHGFDFVKEARGVAGEYPFIYLHSGFLSYEDPPTDPVTREAQQLFREGVIDGYAFRNGPSDDLIDLLDARSFVDFAYSRGMDIPGTGEAQYRLMQEAVHLMGLGITPHFEMPAPRWHVPLIF